MIRSNLFVNFTTFTSIHGIACERYFRGVTPRKHDSIDRAINVLADRSIAIATLPTPQQGPPVNDSEIVRLAVRFAERLLERKLKSASHDEQPLVHSFQQISVFLLRIDW